MEKRPRRNKTFTRRRSSPQISKGIQRIPIILMLIVFFAVIASSQTGGDYRIEKSVVAGGGGQSSGGIYSVTGTIGQPAVGTPSAGGVFKIYSGFWTPEYFVPTAALARISGIVVGPNGIGLKDSFVTVTRGPLSAPRVVRTNTFGRFVVDGLEVGQAYFLQVSNRRYEFEQPMQVVNLLDNISNIRFQAMQ